MLVIRPETTEDAAAVRQVNEEAFGRRDEADIVEKLRSRQAFTLSLVATCAEKVVGHILFSPVTIESEFESFAVLGLGPVAVLPPYQNKGIGSQLIRTGIEICRKAGHKVIVLVGHPTYYPRFGFLRASTYDLKYEYDVPDEAFMALELRQSALEGRSGIVKFRPEFGEG